MSKCKNSGLINIDLEEAVQLCVEKHFHKTEKQNVRNGLLKKIKEYIDDYNDYEHYYPYSLQWNITSKCNLRCKHCVYKNSTYDSTNDLSTEQVMNLIDELDKMGIVKVTLTGGEIFLREDIFEILKEMKSRNMLVMLLTNGTLVTEVIAKKLGTILNLKMDNLQISLDGATRESHEKTRGQNTFDKTVDCIKNLIKQGLYPSISYVVTNNNILELPKIYQLVNSLNIKNLSIGKFITCDKEQDCLTPDKDILFKAIAEIIKLEASTNKKFFKKSFFSFIEIVNSGLAQKSISKYINPNKKQNIQNINYSCHHHDKLTINPDGSVYLCPYTADNNLCCLGNVKEESLIDIWSRRHVNPLFQKRNSDLMICKDCQYFDEVCHGGCPAGAYEKYGDIHAPDKNCALGEKLMLN